MEFNKDTIYVLQNNLGWVSVVQISSNTSVHIGDHPEDDDYADSAFSAEEVLKLFKSANYEIIQEWK